MAQETRRSATMNYSAKLQINTKNVILARVFLYTAAICFQGSCKRSLPPGIYKAKETKHPRDGTWQRFQKDMKNMGPSVAIYVAMFQGAFAGPPGDDRRKGSSRGEALGLQTHKATAQSVCDSDSNGFFLVASTARCLAH